MRNAVEAVSWAASFSLACSMILPVLGFTEEIGPSAPSLPSSKESKEIASKLETVEVDTRRPVIPLEAVRRLDVSSMSLQETREALRALVVAQQKMAQQMQQLEANIVQSQVEEANHQKQLQTIMTQQNAHAGMLTSLANRTYLTGYVESGWRAYNHAPRTEEFLDANGKRGNSFDLRKTIIRPHMNFTDKATWYTELEIEDAFHEVTIEESIFNYAYKPWLNMKTGMMVLPYTQTAYNHDGPLRLLVDRPLVDQFVIPSTYYDLGAGITGMIPLLKHGGINYEVDVVNGMTDAIFADPSNSSWKSHVSNSLDFQGLRAMRPGEGIVTDNFRDNNSNKTIFSKLGFSPFPGLMMNVSASHGKIDQNNHVGLTMMAGDLQYRHKRFSFLGEAAASKFNNKAGVSSQGIPFKQFPNAIRGYFLQAAYDITPKLTAIGAYNFVNMDSSTSNNKMQRYSTGLRYNPFNNVYLKTEYQHTIPRGIFSGVEKSSDALLTQLTFYYR